MLESSMSWLKADGRHLDQLTELSSVLLALGSKPILLLLGVPSRHQATLTLLHSYTVSL
jgi:hypothetical protein